VTIIYLIVAWFLGIWLSRALAFEPAVWWSATAVALLAILLLRRQREARLVLACVVALGLGAARYQAALPQIDEHHLAYYNDRDGVRLTAVVVDEPDVRDQITNLRLRAETIVRDDGRVLPVQGLLLASVPRYPAVAYGSRLQLDGRLETPPENPAFSYRDYLARQGVHSTMSRPRLRVLEEGQGHPFYHALLVFKGRAQATINRSLPDPHGPLLSAVLLGARGDLPPALLADFRATGLSHLIVVSGFHVSVLAASLAAAVTPLLGRRQATWVTLACLVLYTILVGAGPSVQRAAVMGGIYLFAARFLGRPTFAPAALVTAAGAMSLWNPLILWEVGFQLSFGATLGIILYAERLQRAVWLFLARRSDAETASRISRPFLEILIVSLSAQVLTLPLVAAYFGQLSLVTLPANLLVLPAQPALLMLGGLATLVGMVWPAAGQLLAWTAWLFLHYTLEVVRALATIPGAAVPIYISGGGIIFVYAAVLGATWYLWQGREARHGLRQGLAHSLTPRLALAVSGLAVALVTAWGFSQPDGKLRVTFLNVGHGEAIFIQTPQGRQVLVDGGAYATVLYEQLGRQMPFWDRHLDLVIATQPDPAHTAALPGIFRRYRVDRLLLDGAPAGLASAEELAAAAGAAGVPIHYALAGETILLDEGVRLELLHPGGLSEAGDRRDNSVVLRLVYGDFNLLLTGAAGLSVEEWLLQQPRPLQSLVLKAGRSGANQATGEAFLAAVQPRIVVISAGRENRRQDPQPELLERIAGAGASLLRTDELGAITVITDGQTMWWQAR
jgi:competence protein ComEC